MNVKQLEKKLSGYTFFPESGRACWHCYAYPIIEQTLESGKPWAVNYEKFDTAFASYSNNHIVKWFFIEKDESVFLNFIKTYISNLKLLEDLKTDIGDLKNSIATFIDDKDFQKLTNNELGLIFSDYFELYRQFFKGSMTLRKIDRGVISALRKNFPKNSDEVIRTVSVTIEQSFSLQEEIAVLSLAVLIKEKGLSFDSTSVIKGIKDLLDKYAWGVLGYYTEQPNTKEKYKDRLQGLMNENPKILLKSINDRIREDFLSRKKLLEKFSDEQKKIAHIASSVAYLKDFTKFCLNESQYRFEDVFVEIAERVGKSIDYIKDLEVKEVVALLAGKSINESFVTERIKENFLIGIDGKLFTFVGLDAAEIKEKYIESVDKKEKKEFRGRVASVGYAKGRAILVHDVGDFNKVLDGDILIVMNTSPDFMPVIRKAGGIVAEEGGITAHVSVVSREFGIPCIVGINNVTKMIKDGDLVEVQTERGIVTILNK